MLQQPGVLQLAQLLQISAPGCCSRRRRGSCWAQLRPAEGQSEKFTELKASELVNL